MTAAWRGEGGTGVTRATTLQGLGLYHELHGGIPGAVSGHTRGCNGEYLGLYGGHT